jgi:predicted MFS family arabinose efflux permease
LADARRHVDQWAGQWHSVPSRIDTRAQRIVKGQRVLATLRQRNFALLWTAGLISFIGDWALLATLPIYLYQRTGSTLASGGIFLTYATSHLLVGSVAGVFVDRWDRRRTMVIVTLLQALLTPVLLLGLRDDWLGIVYLVTFVEGALLAFFTPAENALLPRLVGDERLITANALNALNDNLARIAGPAVGGLLLVTWGFAGVVVVNAASFLLAALLIAAIAVPGSPDAISAEAGQVGSVVVAGWTGVWAEWVAGLRLIGTDPFLRTLVLIGAISALADSLNTALSVPFLLEVVGGGAGTVSLILTLRGVAGLLGGVIVARLGPLLAPARLLGGSLVAIAALFGIMINVPVLPVIVAVRLALGPPTMGWIVTSQTLQQTATEDRFRGRVFGAVGTTTSLLAIAGTGIGSGLGDLVGIVPLYNLAALLYGGAGVLALLRLRSVSELRSTERGSEAGATS